MSSFITESFVQKFSTNVMLDLQQRDSRFSMAVMQETAFGDSAKVVDHVGEVTAVRVTERHGNTPQIDTPHDASWADPVDYDWADLIDKVDRARLIINPGDAYAKAGAAALRRAKDDEINAAFFGSRKTGYKGNTTTAFGGATVVAGGAGLTKLKLEEIIENFLEADVDLDQEDVYMAIGPKQHTDLLAIDEVISSDYNTTKPLGDGAVLQFMGINFIVSNRLTLNGSNRLCPAWIKSRMRLVTWNDIVIDVAERKDKRNATQVYVCGTFGATRTEEEGVQQVQCLES